MNNPLEAAIGESLEDVPQSAPSGMKNRFNAKFFYALMDQGIVSFGNMVVAASVSRHCRAAEFGIFILALRSIDVITQLCSVFIWAPYIFNLPSMPEGERKRYLGSVVFHQFAGSILAILALLALGVIALHMGNTPYRSVFIPLALPSLTIVLREFTRRMYFAHFRFRDAFIADAITVVLQIGGIFLLIHYGRLHSASALWALAFGCLFVSVFWIVKQWKHWTISMTAIGKHLSLNFELGRWFFGSNMVFLMSSQANPWILSVTSGASSVGAYAVCESVVNIPRVALTSMQNTMGPMMARTYASGGKVPLKRLVWRMGLFIAACTAVFSVIIMTAGPSIAYLIFHVVPANARVVLILLALNLFAFGSGLTQSYGLTALNKPGFNFYANLIGLFVQLVLAFALVRSTGPMGGLTAVALALLVGSIVVLVVRAAFYIREVRHA
ncbi:MAG: lipopolysaccharide biosynthesis protein [Acidobacteriaceae bacterium]